MKYVLNNDNKSIKDRILEINHLSEEDLNVSNFIVNKDLDIICKFRNFLQNNKDLHFFIVGDYDCDGICATTIIKKLLDDLNIKNNYYIPSRSKEGYGINNNIVNTAIENHFDVIVMVDNGVVANTQIELANSNGIKTVVIDHHEYAQMPNSDLFIHPNLFPQKYEDMCAAGLCALLSNSIREDDLTICLGGIATLADMVKVLNYNRYLIIRMMDIIREKNVYSIKYLLQSNDLSYTSLQFNVIPKINAISRLDSILNVNFMPRYFLSSESEALSNVLKIEDVNNKRKQLSKQMYESIISSIDLSNSFIVVKSSEFIEGLCGLLANRLLSEFNKPVLVLSEKNNELKGSGRSPSGFNIYDYLKPCEELFTTFGGHQNALGLSLDLKNYNSLINYIDNHEVLLSEENVDVLLLEENEITFDLLSEIEELGPYGTGFNMPLLAIRNNNYKNIIIAGRYPKYLINEKLDAICFKQTKVKNFEFMIGSLNIDSYHKNKLSFIIDDFI